MSRSRRFSGAPKEAPPPNKKAPKESRPLNVKAPKEARPPRVEAPKEAPPSMEVNATDVNTDMGNQGEHDKHVETAKKVAAGAAVAGGGYLIYKNIANRVKKKTVKSKDEAVALHKEEREKVIKKEGKKVAKAEKAALEEGNVSEKSRKAYLEALEEEQKNLIAQNEQLASTSVFSELNSGELKQVSGTKYKDAKVLSQNIAKEQKAAAEKRLDAIAEKLGMERTETKTWTGGVKKGWKKKGELKPLTTEDKELVEDLQKKNTELLADTDVLKSESYEAYKAAAAEGANGKTAQEILDDAKDATKAEPPATAEGEVPTEAGPEATTAAPAAEVPAAEPDAAPDVVEKAPTDVVEEAGADPGWAGAMEGAQDAALETEAAEVAGGQASKEEAERVMTTLGKDLGEEAVAVA